MLTMKTYGVRPEGINPIRKRMLMFGAAALLIVLAGVGMIIPEQGLTPPGFGVVALFVVLFGGLGFYRSLRRMSETWPSYTLTVADDYILKQQSHYPDIRIERNEVTAIWKASTGDIVVKTRDWKKFIAIPRSLNGLEEVEGILNQWKPIRQYPRTKTFLSYSLAFLIPLVVVVASRGYLRNHTPSLPAIFITVLVMIVLNLFILWTLRRFPNLDERSKPKRRQFIFTIVYILLLVISMAVFFALKK